MRARRAPAVVELQGLQRLQAGCTSGLRLPDGTDDVGLTARAAAAGFLVSPGRPWPRRRAAGAALEG